MSKPLQVAAPKAEGHQSLMPHLDVVLTGMLHPPRACFKQHRALLPVLPVLLPICCWANGEILSRLICMTFRHQQCLGKADNVWC